MNIKDINWDNVEFKNEKRFLSNMYPCKVIINGVEYQSSENYYMAMKFLGTSDNLVDEIQKCTPLQSKRVANKNKSLIREDWDSVKIPVMRRALFAKFTQNLELMSSLLATGSSHLEERNDWKDVFWGTCEGVGSNHLGKLLMELRSTIADYECHQSIKAEMAV